MHLPFAVLQLAFVSAVGFVFSFAFKIERMSMKVQCTLILWLHGGIAQPDGQQQFSNRHGFRSCEGMRGEQAANAS